ncbi:hypothetical protein QJQ45_017254 [Haematococcus lacustris]|nr:hypothetical protein QJQ45_017254 [Haematococcus lacustris]
MTAFASLTRGSTAALLLLTLLGAACELGAESGLLRPLNTTGTCSKPAIVQSLPANTYVMLGLTASTCNQKPSWKGLAGADITYLLRAEDHDRSIWFSTCRRYRYRSNNLHVFKPQSGICSLEAAALKAVTVASAIDSCAGPTFIAKAGQEYLVVSEAVRQPDEVITDFTFLLRGDDTAVRTVSLRACKFTDPVGVTPKLTIYKAGPAACGKDEAAKAALKQTGSLEGNNCDNGAWGVRTTFTAQPGQDYLVVWGGMGRERQTLSWEKCLTLCRPVNAMVNKKRGVMARCAGAQKAREIMSQRRAAEAEAKAQAGAAEAEAQAQADAGAYEADEAGADEAGAYEADAGAYEAEGQAQADAHAYEAQLHQLQPELQQREQQTTDTQRLQHLQQQLQDLQQDELQRKEQQVAEQQQQLQQQQADMHLREQQLAEQQHQLQQQQADMQQREQQVAQQQQQVQQQQADLQQREQQVAQQHHQVQQQQADLQLREQQVAQQKHQVQQQQADLQQREQQVAQQHHQVQQQQADLQQREQQVAQQNHQVQQQQADLQLREQQVAQQHHQVQLQQQLNRLQEQLEAQSGAELQRQVQQQLAAQQHLLQQQQADLLLKQQQVEKQPQEAAVQQAVSTHHPLPDHSTCSPQVPGSLRSPLFMRPRQDTTIAPMPRLHSVAHALRIPGLPYSEVVGAHQSLLLATAPPPPQPRPAQQAQSNPKQPPPSSPSYLPPPPLHGGTASGLAVRAWGRSLTEYFSAWGMPGDLWVPYAAGRLTGGAEVWWSHQVFNNTPAATCWMAFVGGHYQDMAGNYKEESVFVSADRCDQSAEASTTALVQVIECLLQGRRHPDGILGVASNPDGVGDGRDDGEGWVGKMDMRQLCLWSDGCASQFKGAKAIRLHWHLANRFGVPVQWSYGATSHFKSTHDSEGGVAKREWREQMLVHPELVGKVCGAAVLTGCMTAGWLHAECSTPHMPTAPPFRSLH